MQPADYKDFIRMCGGITAFAKKMGIHYMQAYQMDKRNVISSVYWEEMIELAKELGIPGVTPEWFFRLHAKRRGRWRRKPNEAR